MDDHDLLATCWTTAGPVRSAPDDERSPVPALQRIGAAADAGFAGIGFGGADLAEIRATIGFDALGSALDDAGIVWVRVGALRRWWSIDTDVADDTAITRDRDRERHTDRDTDRDRSIAERSTLLEAAAALRASQVVVEAPPSSTGLRPDDLLPEWYRLAAQVEAVGAQLVLEAAPWSVLPCTEAAARFVQGAAHPNGGILIDAVSVLRGGSTGASLIETVDPEYLFAVDLSDCAAVAPPTWNPAAVRRDAEEDRVLPGSGMVDLPSFIRTMRRIGFDEPWGVHVRTSAFRAMPVGAALARAATATRATLDAADAADAAPVPAMPRTPAPASAVDYDLPFTSR